jgi:hypothetical protein
MISRTQRRARGERGYALLLVFAMSASIAIMLYTELPRVAFEHQRAKEQILIDRGEEYKRGIQLYFRKHQRYPAKIEDLVETNNVRFLRRRFKDPMTEEGEWRLVHIGPAGEFYDSLVHAPKPDEKESLNANTFITEGPAIGSGLATGPGQDAGMNIAMRRRPSDEAPPPGQGPDGFVPAEPGDPQQNYGPQPAQPGGPGILQQPGEYPQQPGEYPQQSGHYPQQPGQYPQQPGQGLEQPAGQYPPQQPGQYPPQQPGQYPPQQPGQYPPQQPGQYPPQQPGQYPQQQPGMPNQQQGYVQPGGQQQYAGQNIPPGTQPPYPPGTPQAYQQGHLPGTPQGGQLGPDGQQAVPLPFVQNLQGGQMQGNLPGQQMPGQAGSPASSGGVGAGYSTSIGSGAVGSGYAGSAVGTQPMPTPTMPPGFPQQRQPVPNQTGRQMGPNQAPAGMAPGVPGAPAGPQGANPAAQMIQDLLTRPRPGGLQGAQGQQQGQMIGAGIAGVASKKESLSIKVYGEREQYNEWEFLYDFRQDTGIGGAQGGQGLQAPPSGQPGQQGPGQSPQMNQPGPFGPPMPPNQPGRSGPRQGMGVR